MTPRAQLPAKPESVLGFEPDTSSTSASPCENLKADLAWGNEMLLGVVIFTVTYVVVSAQKMGRIGLDRPGGALLGAIACVFAGVLTPEAAIRAVDGRTLLLLFGMMGMGAFLASDGFFDRAAEALAARAGTPARLLGALIWGAGGLAALITNDAVCVLGAPLVVQLIQRYRLPPLPFLLALATASNTGSVATLVGNPQNMLCAILGGLSYREHLILMLPVAMFGLAMNHALLAWLFRRELLGHLDVADRPKVATRATTITLGVIGASAMGYMLGTDLAWTAAAGLMILFVLERPAPEEIWRRIDWSVLVFFAGLFVVVEGLDQSGAPAWLFERYPLWAGEGAAAWARLATIFLVGSNLVSNVPFILIVRDEMHRVPDAKLAWEMLAMSSTFGGNLLLLGSVANVIVAEKSREVGGMGFWKHLRVGLPLSIATTAVGVGWLLLVS